MRIRQRLLAKDILALVEDASKQLSHGGYPCERLWILNPRIRQIADRMSRFDLNFEVVRDGYEGTFKIRVLPRSE